EDELAPALQHHQVLKERHVGENCRDQVGEDLAGVVLARKLVDVPRQGQIETIALANHLVDLLGRHERETEPLREFGRDPVAAASVLVRDRYDRQRSTRWMTALRRRLSASPCGRSRTPCERRSCRTCWPGSWPRRGRNRRRYPPGALSGCACTPRS